MRNSCHGIIGCLIKNNYNFSMRPVHVPSGMLNKKQTSQKKKEERCCFSEGSIAASIGSLWQFHHLHGDDKDGTCPHQADGGGGEKASLALPAEITRHICHFPDVLMLENSTTSLRRREAMSIALQDWSRGVQKPDFRKEEKVGTKINLKRKINEAGEMAKIKNKLDEMMARSKTFNSIFSFA